MDQLLSIREVAARTSLSAHTLRYYERVGLLDPVGRASSGHRRYAASDLAWIEFLTRLRATGMTIRRMCEFAELRRRGEATVSERRALLQRHQREVEGRVRALEQDLAALAAKIAEYERLEQLAAATRGELHEHA